MVPYDLDLSSHSNWITKYPKMSKKDFLSEIGPILTPDLPRGGFHWLSFPLDDFEMSATPLSIFWLGCHNGVTA